MNVYSGKPQLMKRVNSALLRETLKNGSVMTKAELVKRTGMSLTTIVQLISSLAESGIVVSKGYKESTGGRRAELYSLTSSSAYAVSLALEADRIDFSISDALGDEVDRGCAAHVRRNAFAEAAKIVQHCISRFSPLGALCIGVPGVVQSGRLLSGRLMEASKGKLLKNFFSAYDSVPFAVENDMNAVALGYARESDPLGQMTENLAYVHFSTTCTGSGIICNGELIRGHANFAGELGYLPLGHHTRLDDLVRSDTGDAEYALAAACMISALNCVVNPASVVIGGEGFRSSCSELIISACAEMIEEKVRPRIMFIKDKTPYYLAGLRGLATDLIYSDFRLVGAREGGKINKRENI